ncbi:MAG: metallo-beta-lactamase family protein [Mariniblastus sp.]|jgi:metallo-beta-lactamase family protein
MKVQFWGAAQTVTGSMHLIHHAGRQILLDCGLYQGRRKIAFEKNRELPFDGEKIDAVILSHAHIDHSGNLPSLVKSGFKGAIYATSATRDLAAIMLLDSAKIQTNDVKYVNKRRKKKNQTPFTPLYETPHAVQTLKQFRSVEYEMPFHPLPGVEVRFHVAGHMLGAAIVEVLLDAEEPGGKPTRLVFSGDIGRPDMPILRDPVTVPGADYLIMEATYGDRIHPEGGDAKKTLKEAAHTVYNAGGKLIIPAFSVGRTQEIVYRLNLLAEAGELPPMKVYVDSPLAVNTTDIFRDHVECFDDDMINAILSEEDEDPLDFGKLHYVRHVNESKALNHSKEPCIIISASGMCEAGRILHHLKNNIEKSSTMILFAGYQAPHTLGRILLDGSLDRVKIYGQEYQVKAQVCKLQGSSGHADQQELLEWAATMAETGNIKQVALVHCELDSATEFKQKLEQKKIGPVIIPAPGDEMIMDSLS